MCTFIQSRFQTAMKVVGKEFTECVLDYKNAWMPARNIVKKALDTRHQVYHNNKTSKSDILPFNPPACVISCDTEISR